jgi:uncharacterized protein
MKKIFGAIICLSLTAVVGHAQNVFFNELHYDNAGADMNEFLEFAMDSSLDVSMVTVELYNGADGMVYGGMHSGTDFTLGSTVNGISFYYLSAGIQNGPDGMALSYGGSLVQFLSYEGTFMGTNGIANGVTSTDIGVFEDGTGTSSQSIGLNGTGRTYSDFTWAGPLDATPGGVNDGQEITAVPEPGTLLLLGLGAGLLGVVQRFRKKSF